ncbi:MAG: hypothetical protein J6B68_03940 [Lachnospiraceae bacterium]|nr:hypothetical protein [Lachnospiraceae bacterium]
MLNMKYIGDKTEYKISFNKIGNNLVQIKGNIPIKTDGFILTRIGEPEAFTGDYSDYTTIYREIEGGVQFSNDGSVYMPPEPTPTPEPYVPTLEEVKTGRIMESKMLLADYLEKNPLVSTCHGEKEGIYSVTEEKQTLMMSQYMTYTIEKQIVGGATLTWNETGKSCEVWTEEEFLQLIMEIKAYVYPLVSAQQTLEEQINACTTVEEVNSIIIDYGVV